jgi:endonuclease-3 related protein
VQADAMKTQKIIYNYEMNELVVIYEKLYGFFGPQNWWPGDTPFEVAVGAILTQNTNWGNVERAIQNLKNHNLLSPEKMHGMSFNKLATLIRPAGYFNVKTRRLKSFLEFLMEHYQGTMESMAREEMLRCRERLLRVHGIGPETADSILLYALRKPIFVIDAYTKRVLARHGIMEQVKSYVEFQELFHAWLPGDVKLFNEYHALFVRLGKMFCRTKNPLCEACPLHEIGDKAKRD